MPERQVIASLIRDNSLIIECPLLPDDFTVNAHQQIYRRIQQMAIRRQPFDIVTLSADLQGAAENHEWLKLDCDIINLFA